MSRDRYGEPADDRPPRWVADLGPRPNPCRVEFTEAERVLGLERIAAIRAVMAWDRDDGPTP